MNNVRYRNDIIDPHVLPLVRGMRGQVTFQQDNAPPHRARATIAHLQANNIRVMTPWPANSPDLNPLEIVGSPGQSGKEPARPAPYPGRDAAGADRRPERH